MATGAKAAMPMTNTTSAQQYILPLSRHMAGTS